MAENYDHLAGQLIDPRDMNTVESESDLLKFDNHPSFSDAYSDAKAASRLHDQMDFYNQLSKQIKKKK